MLKLYFKKYQIKLFITIPEEVLIELFCEGSEAKHRVQHPSQPGGHHGSQDPRQPCRPELQQVCGSLPISDLITPLKILY